jgi:hypothetical protein
MRVISQAQLSQMTRPKLITLLRRTDSICDRISRRNDPFCDQPIRPQNRGASEALLDGNFKG